MSVTKKNPIYQSSSVFCFIKEEKNYVKLISLLNYLYFNITTSCTRALILVWGQNSYLTLVCAAEGAAVCICMYLQHVCDMRAFSFAISTSVLNKAFINSFIGNSSIILLV